MAVSVSCYATVMSIFFVDKLYFRVLEDSFQTTIVDCDEP